MQKITIQIALILVASSLTACTDMSKYFPGGIGSNTTNVPAKEGVPGATVDQKTGQTVPVNVTMSGGEAIGLKSMDELDRNKMSHALDGSPGKATHWRNGGTGIEYTVIPIKKVVINGNPFCRQYQVLIQKGEYKREFAGTACVTTDGSWHTV